MLLSLHRPMRFRRGGPICDRMLTRRKVDNCIIAVASTRGIHPDSFLPRNPAERVQNRGRSPNIELEKWLQRKEERGNLYHLSLSKSSEVRMLHTEPAIGFERPPRERVCYQTAKIPASRHISRSDSRLKGFGSCILSGTTAIPSTAKG